MFAAEEKGDVKRNKIPWTPNQSTIPVESNNFTLAYKLFIDDFDNYHYHVADNRFLLLFGSCLFGLQIEHIAHESGVLMFVYAIQGLHSISSSSFSSSAFFVRSVHR